MTLAEAIKVLADLANKGVEIEMKTVDLGANHQWVVILESHNSTVERRSRVLAEAITAAVNGLTAVMQ